MGLRVNLHNLLVEALGSRNVYFQPPTNIRMEYPCIVYELGAIDATYADDKPYSHHRRYTVTVIDKNPDSDIPSKIGQFPTSRFDRMFTSDNLNHFVYSLYY